MWVIVGYLVIAGIGASLVTLWLSKTKTHLWSGMVYVRAGLICSALLLAVDSLLFLLLGTWPLNPLFAVAVGFVLPVVMTAII